MLRRIKTIYHDVASMAILTRVFFTDALCPDCTFDEETGMDIRCEKHHEKQFMREGRAYEHFDKTFN